MARYIISSVENGYTIELMALYHERDGEILIARSWREVLEILEENGAPDFETDEAELEI